MRQIIHVLIILFLIVFPSSAFSQQNIDGIYGHDPILYNGEIYAYQPPPSVNGNQFLTESEFQQGYVNIDGVIFNDLLLNYDIYNQFILLKFTLNYRTLIIKLNHENLNKFSIGNKHFCLLPGLKSNKIIYQYFGDGKYQIMYQWQKELNLSNTQSSYYKFLKPKKTNNLYVNNQLFKYKNNRTFLILFKDSDKSSIKTFLKEEKIKVKKASDQQINSLINFCNAL